MADDVVLLIEDSADDALLLERILRSVEPRFRLIWAHDGAEGMKYLKNDGDFSDRLKFPVPRLILLDLKMPYMDGFEFLAWLQESRSVIASPVVVLSGSVFKPDEIRSLELGATSFLLKHGDMDKLGDELRDILKISP